MTGQQPLLVVDGESFAHRAYHALPKSIVRRDGIAGSAIVGFANSLVKLYLEEQPRAVLVGWDTLDVPNHRQALFPAYQSGRVFDEELLQQLHDLPQFVDTCGFANAKVAGYEADDFLAAAVTREETLGRRTVVASGDRDTFQLASDLTTVLYPVRGGVMERVGPNEVRDKYGVEPSQVSDFLALRGDPSDRIPGAKGIGPSIAASILRKYGSLENALTDGRFEQQASELRLYRKIASMDASAPIPKVSRQIPEWGRASALAREWGLNQLADRLLKLQKAS